MEHLSSNSKSIKESLICLAKYIENKKIDSSKFNNIEEFKGFGEAAWRFISTIYNSE